MKLSIKGLAVAAAVLWGGAVLLCGVFNLIWPSYAYKFLAVASSVYPGYHVGMGPGSVVVGALYAILDGAVGGALLAWIYNRFAA